MRVAIAGGGLAGLSCEEQLGDFAFPFIVLRSRDVFGGSDLGGR